MSSLGREIAQPVSIGRPGFRQYPGPATGAILAIPFAAISIWGFATFRASASPMFFYLLSASTGLLLLMSLVTTFFWFRFGMTLSLHELGATLTTRGKEHEIRYADVDALTVRDKRRYDERAVVRVLTRTILIETAGGTVKAQFVASPRETFDETLNLYAERIAAQSRPREGKGWRVDLSTLHARGNTVPLSTITAAGLVERDVRLWKNRETHPFLSIPHDSTNARVLLALASRIQAIEATPVIETSAPSSGLGRLLFDRRTSLSSVFGNTLIAAFAIACAFGLIIKFVPAFIPHFKAPAIGVFALWLIYAFHRATVRYRFHERALVRSTLFSSRTLAYSDVASMRWHLSSTSLEHAIPMGTTTKATLVPDDGSSAVSIRLHRFRGEDHDLAAVRQAIAQNIANKLREEFDRGNEVAWTKDAKFTRDGVAVKKQLFAYDEPIGILIRGGYLMFYRESWNKPLAILDAGGVNFYSGLILCSTLMPNMVTEAA